MYIYDNCVIFPYSHYKRLERTVLKLVPFYCLFIAIGAWWPLDVTNSTLSTISAVLAIFPCMPLQCDVQYLSTCTYTHVQSFPTHQCTTPDCGVFFASRTVDFGIRYQFWTPRSRGKSVFYSLRQCSPDNEPGMYVTICMECGWRWCVAIICCVYSLCTLNTTGVAVWYVLVRNPISTSIIQ